jgi:N-acetylglutamate synthase-like GNAT family acetyltransferase
MVGLKIEYLHDTKNQDVGRCFVIKNNNAQVGITIFKELNSIDVYLNYSVTQNIKNITATNKDMMCIQLLKINASYQNKGLGKKLVNLVIEKAKELNCKSLFVRAEPFPDSRMDLEELIEWYYQFGFYRLKRISRTEQLMQMDL